MCQQGVRNCPKRAVGQTSCPPMSGFSQQTGMPAPRHALRRTAANSAVTKLSGMTRSRTVYIRATDERPFAAARFETIGSI